MAISAALFPPEHPYHWMTIGAAEDIKAMRLDDVHDFFRTYYHPANASLTVAGTSRRRAALDLAERYFGELRPGPEPAPVTAAATLPVSTVSAWKIVWSCRACTWAWHSPAMSQTAMRRWISRLICSPGGKTSRFVSNARVRAAHCRGRLRVSGLT
jgi:predicted Zn-dependent peptidase